MNASQKPQFRRSIFLIDTRFQMKFAFFVCSWLVAVCFIYPILFSSLFDFFRSYLVNDLKIATPQPKLDEVRGELIWLILIFQASYLVMTFLISLFISHRIAGPIYKIRSVVAHLRAGKTDERVHLRTKDHFQEVAPEFNELITAMQQNSRDAVTKISAAIKDLESGTEDKSKVQGILASLREARENLL